jgi:hypothetical protein
MTSAALPAATLSVAGPDPGAGMIFGATSPAIPRRSNIFSISPRLAPSCGYVTDLASPRVRFKASGACECRAWPHLSGFQYPVMCRNTIPDRNSDMCFAYQYQSSSRSNGSSQRSTNTEWKRYSNQRLNMSKSRLTGQEDGTRYHPSSCSSKISPHTSSR